MLNPAGNRLGFYHVCFGCQWSKCYVTFSARIHIQTLVIYFHSLIVHYHDVYMHVGYCYQSAALPTMVSFARALVGEELDGEASVYNHRPPLRFLKLLSHDGEEEAEMF